MLAPYSRYFHSDYGDILISAPKWEIIKQKETHCNWEEGGKVCIKRIETSPSCRTRNEKKSQSNSPASRRYCTVGAINIPHTHTHIYIEQQSHKLRFNIEIERELVVSGGKAYTRLERGVLFSCQGVCCVAIEFDIFQRPVLLISRIVRRMRMRKIEEEAPAARKFATPYYNPERYDERQWWWWWEAKNLHRSTEHRNREIRFGSVTRDTENRARQNGEKSSMCAFTHFLILSLNLW